MSHPQGPSLARCIEACFKKLESDIDAGGEVTDQHLFGLNLLVGKNWPKALQLVDEGSVKCFVGETSKRRVYQVQGKSSGDQYIVFPAHFCTCHYFHYDVVCKVDATHCKHQLAARLAQALQRCPEIVVPDAALAAILMGM